jgi:hypothetical protein
MAKRHQMISLGPFFPFSLPPPHCFHLASSGLVIPLSFCCHFTVIPFSFHCCSDWPGGGVSIVLPFWSGTHSHPMSSCSWWWIVSLLCGCDPGHHHWSYLKRCVSTNKRKSKLVQKLVQMYVNNASTIKKDTTTQYIQGQMAPVHPRHISPLILSFELGSSPLFLLLICIYL